MNVCLNRVVLEFCGHFTRFNLIKLVSVKNLRLYLSGFWRVAPVSVWSEAMVQPRGEMHQKNAKLFKFISLQEAVQKYEHPRHIFHLENWLQQLFTRQSIYRVLDLSNRIPISDYSGNQCFNRSFNWPIQPSTFKLDFNENSLCLLTKHFQLRHRLVNDNSDRPRFHKSRVWRQ